jgi:adenylosuccinate lyase
MQQQESMQHIDNVLAFRYASAIMKDIWSLHSKIKLERELWIAVMKAQKALGLEIPEEAIKAYESVAEIVNPDSINARERVLKHDVKARIEEFNHLAKAEYIHQGMTSRDLTENVEQLQILRSLKIVQQKMLTAITGLAEQAEKYKTIPLAARTHNVVAQPTTIGRRLAMYGEEMMWSFKRLTHLIENYPCRGIKGAVGTQTDQLTLLQDHNKVKHLEEQITTYLGFNNRFNNVGQVYPRSLDFDVVSTLVLVGSASANFATTIRLMAGHELATEGFADNQVGSSAMPHKMNARSLERITGLHQILKGHLSMIANITGQQWNEGDVSCSVVRRVVMPDSFFTIDAILDTTLLVLNKMAFFENLVQQELHRYAPFLATTTLMMNAIKHGLPREEAHKIIKEHAINSAIALREGYQNSAVNSFAENLANDPNFPLKLPEIEQIIQSTSHLIGLAVEQVNEFTFSAKSLRADYPNIELLTDMKIDIL